jgi:type II secretory pathway predicted ATPase ExeA
MAAMDDGVRWLVLTGPEGIGKTTVLRRLRAEVEGAGADAVVLEGSALPGPDEIANALREELGLPARRAGMLRRAASLADVVASRRGSGRPLVVVLDDAHAVAWRGFGLLATLAARAPEGEPEAYVVLAGAPALIDTAGGGRRQPRSGSRP